MTRVGRSCVQFILDLAARVEQQEERLASVGGAGASGLEDEFEAAVVGSAEDAGAAAGGGAREGQGVDAPGGRGAQGWRAVWASGCGSGAAA